MVVPFQSFNYCSNAYEVLSLAVKCFFTSCDHPCSKVTPADQELTVINGGLASKGPRPTTGVAGGGGVSGGGSMIETPLVSALERDGEFLARLLRAAEDDPRLRVDRLHATPAARATPNLMSSITRMHLFGRRGSQGTERSFRRVLLVKRQTSGGAMRRSKRSDPAFCNEAAAYDVVLPALRAACDSAAAACDSAAPACDPVQLPFAPCLYASSQLLILHDLSQDGYVMADRRHGLDFHHCRIVFQTLAKFHAASLVMKHNDRAGFDRMRGRIRRRATCSACRMRLGRSRMRFGRTRLRPRSTAVCAVSTLAKFHAASLVMKHNDRAGFDRMRGHIQELIFVPEAVPVMLPSSQLLILHDLSQDGYVMADRRHGLDFHHCRIVFQTLAKFHAASLVMKHNDRAGFDRMRGHIQELIFVPEAVPVFGASLENSLKMAIATLKSWCGPEDVALDDAIHKLQMLQGGVFQRMVTVIAPKEPLAVICHGDFWVNNMLFRYNEEDKSVEDVKFVDLQVTRYASPVTDMLLFLYTSADRDVTRLHYDELLEIYLDQLTASVCQLAPSAPAIKLKDIVNEIERHALYALLMVLLLLPAVTADPVPDDVIPNNYETADQLCNDLKKKGCLESTKECLTPRYREHVRDMVLEFVDRGFI
ncbi:uncharacterized protein LOC111045664 [Nilaparvata lugens]|uniref:uncharacterized protein LOC111045664 n=1 Tax=Nilaparvata lugens TaxID=108931 RepID=UPI00193C892B|nr:uncharacterized protein LOC111045664 [Nilaparvata lugens]